MRIPFRELSAEALRGVIEEYVSREGTEYGWRDFSMEEKVAQVVGQLERGEAEILFDPDSQTCHLAPVDRQHRVDKSNE